MYLLVQTFVVLAAATGVPASTAAADPGAGRVDALVLQARVAGLARSAAWLGLGHWRPTLWGGWKSEADGPAFFLAEEDGKHDPAAELEATIRAFFSREWVQTPDWLPAAGRAEDPGGEAVEGPGSERRPVSAAIAPWRVLPHPLCRFPARLAFLEDVLGIRQEELPQVVCPGLEEFRQAMSVTGVDLVFSSYYLNNPASAFGHTFLRIERAGSLVRGVRRDLLDFAIDFSADVDTRNSLAYVVKGLTGRFPGRFHRIPYYYKVREYSDYESRDIWEYQLALEKRQMDALVDHIWELGWTHFDYFYLDENCAYHILGAIDAVLPDLSLLEGLKSFVLPADTVKVLEAVDGLVTGVHYRPSLRTQFRARAAGMTRQEARAVLSLVSDPGTVLPAAFEAEQ